MAKKYSRLRKATIAKTIEFSLQCNRFYSVNEEHMTYREVVQPIDEAKYRIEIRVCRIG